MVNRVIHGDCLKVSLPSNHFDTLITDPPYGLSFMGKDWDAGVPGKAFWKKFFDACKPGAFAFVFGGTRTYHRLACAIEDAGWEIRDCMMWLQGQGFPKSLNIGKEIDKLQGNTREIMEKLPKPGFKTAASNYQNNKAWSGQATKGTSEWEGYGTALKPAWEPIIVAMKPLDGTFAHNAEKWGVGGLWIDGGRIGTNPGYKYNADKNGTTFHGQQGERIPQTAEKKGQQFIESIKGRWPANVILDEEAGAMLDEQSGMSKSTKSQRGKVEIFKKEKSWIGESTERGFEDSGGASRFFYQAKAATSERNKGCDKLFWLDGKQIPEQIWATLNAENEANKDNKDFKKHPIAHGNIHNTVKPLALMEYLCKLSRPPQGGIVLDPFAGSGTTALACVNIDRQYVVIEKEREYCEIIAARLSGVPIETTITQRPRLSNA